jgi:hypothetical protein
VVPWGLDFSRPANIRLGKKWLAKTNTLAYYDKATIRAVKSLKVHAPGACIIKRITAVIYGFRNKP